MMREAVARSATTRVALARSSIAGFWMAARSAVADADAMAPAAEPVLRRVVACAALLAGVAAAPVTVSRPATAELEALDAV
jgi:hypothetical protein